jgi:steroid delta-isomerase-like uncharacterized protein
MTDAGAVVSEYEALWNGDSSNLDILSENVVLLDQAVPEGRLQGRAAFEKHLRTVHEAFPDFELRTIRMVAEDETVMLEWSMTGTLERGFYAAPPTGRRMEVEGMSTMRVRDGRVEEDRLYYDDRVLYDQLGLSFPGIIRVFPGLVRKKLAGRW